MYRTHLLNSSSACSPAMLPCGSLPAIVRAHPARLARSTREGAPLRQLAKATLLM